MVVRSLERVADEIFSVSWGLLETILAEDEPEGELLLIVQVLVNSCVECIVVGTPGINSRARGSANESPNAEDLLGKLDSTMLFSVIEDETELLKLVMLSVTLRYAEFAVGM